MDERTHLEHIARHSKYLAGPNPAMITYSSRLASRYLAGPRFLELGPAEGVLTEYLYAVAEHLTLVDGADSFCRMLRVKFPNATVIQSLFEDYNPSVTYDSIVLGHVLEHVEDPCAILQKCKSWITSGTGRIFAAVPNARSLHRQAAVIMGLLSAEDAMNEMDLHHGHRRVFNPESFRNTFIQAGLHIEVFGGFWLKPVSNRQIEESWTDEMLDAFMKLGERYPDIAGELYIVASHQP